MKEIPTLLLLVQRDSAADTTKWCCVDVRFKPNLILQNFGYSGPWAKRSACRRHYGQIWQVCMQVVPELWFTIYSVEVNVCDDVEVIT